MFFNSNVCKANDKDNLPNSNAMRCCKEYAYDENECGEWKVGAATSCTSSETISMNELCLTAYLAAYHSIDRECDKSEAM